MPNVETVARLTDVAAGWLLTYLVHSTVVLLAVWAIAAHARLTVAVRDILWKTALVGGIVTATVQTAATREPLGGQLRLAPRTAGAAPPAMRVAVRDDVPGATPRVFVMRPRGTRWTSAVVVLWLATAGAGLLWLTIGQARTLGALGDRTPLDGTPVAARLRRLLVRAGVEREVELTASSAIASPVALLGGEVCVPRRALLELAPVEQDSMLAHEVAHLVRGDPQWLVVARAIEMVLFFQPLNRLARHRMQEVAEYLCDDWAVARTSQPVTLAKCLAAVAEWVGRSPDVETPRLHPVSAMVESSGSPLVRRVGRILNGGGEQQPGKGRVAIAASAFALALLAAVVPRVSIANAAGARRVTLVRAVAGPIGLVPREDSLVLLRGGPALPFDSLVRQARVRAIPLLDAGESGILFVERRSDR